MNDRSTLADLVPDAAARAPDHSALRDLGETWTWTDAELQIAKLSAALADAGIEAGDRVAVHHRKSADGFLAMHAVVRRGAIAVPLDPRASVDYVRSVAASTGCRAVLTHDLCRPSALALAAAIPEINTVIGLDESQAGPDPKGSAIPPSRTRVISPAEVATLEPIGPTPTDFGAPAYIITTSGSTGRPKGICHTHDSALAYVRFKLAAFDFNSQDRIGDIAPNHFDISTQALWVTPTIGATNIVVREQYQMLPASLSQLMADEQMTVWYGVPYLLAQLQARGLLADRDLDSLRWVMFGGEVMAPNVLAKLMRAIPRATFSNVYGPAEVNACTVYHLPTPPADGNPIVDSIPIGAPVADTEIRLAPLDDGPLDAKPVDDGDKGEVWVKGPTMMAGYWDQPDFDRSSIVADESGDGGWYRTGDVAWRRTDGELVFAGRLDHQVKVRGHRVELEAIESALEELPEVEVAVAAVERRLDGGDVVTAGLQTEPSGRFDDLDLAVVAAHAASRLPRYACPAQWHPIPSMPTTGSGKLDRAAIRRALIESAQQEGFTDDV